MKTGRKKDVMILTGAGQIGMAVLLEEVGKIIRPGGVGATASCSATQKA